MTDFNPSNPDVAGNEWTPGRDYGRNLSTSLAIGAFIDSSSAETIRNVRAYIARQAGGKLGANFVQIACDIYEGDDVFTAEDEQQQAISLPTETADVGSIWEECSTGTGCDPATSGAWAFVNTAVGLAEDPNIGTSEYMRAVKPFTSHTAMMFRGDSSLVDGDDAVTAATVGSGQRVAAVQVVMIVGDHGEGSSSVAAALTIDGDDYLSAPQVVTTPTPQRLTFTFAHNPATLRQWCLADLDQFYDTGTGAWGVDLRAPAGVGFFRVYSIQLVITYIDERRVATGYANVTNGWTNFRLRDVEDESTQDWSKANTTEYLVVFSLTGDGGAATLSVLDAANVEEDPTNALTGIRYGDVRIFGGGSSAPVFSPEPTLLGNPLYAYLATAAPAVTLIDDTDTYSLDGQPYARVYRTGMNVNSDPVRQYIESVGSEDYASVRFVVGAKPTTNADLSETIGQVLQNGPLTIAVKRTSDDVTMATATLEAEDLQNDGRYHKLVRSFASSVALVSGTGYYIEYTTTSTYPYFIVYLDHRTPSVTAQQEIGLGGTDEYFSFQGLTPPNALLFDGIASLLTAPDPPATLTATEDTITQPLSALSGCSIPDTPVVVLAWDATSLAADFAFYEIQRKNEADDSYSTIAVVTREDITEFTDVESAMGQNIDYRIRVGRLDGAISDWEDADPLAIFLPVGAIKIATNAAPEKTMSFHYETPDIWTRSTAKFWKTVHLMGRDLPVGFRPLETGGDQFRKRLIVSAADAVFRAFPGLGGRSIFDPLVDLIETIEAPYMLVADSAGVYWFTFAVLDGELRREEPHARYHADVMFTQVASVPSPVEVA